jgi:hypothetical protein
MEIDRYMSDPPKHKQLYTGKIKLSYHAKERMKQRKVNANIVIRNLRFIPYEYGVRKWYIPGTNLFVAFKDNSELNRIIITLGVENPDWKPENDKD